MAKCILFFRSKQFDGTINFNKNVHMVENAVCGLITFKLENCHILELKVEIKNALVTKEINTGKEVIVYI